MPGSEGCALKLATGKDLQNPVGRIQVALRRHSRVLQLFVGGCGKCLKIEIYNMMARTLGMRDRKSCWEAIV